MKDPVENTCLECAVLGAPKDTPLLIRLGIYGALGARLVERADHEKAECCQCQRFAVLVSESSFDDEEPS